MVTPASFIRARRPWSRSPAAAAGSKRYVERVAISPSYSSSSISSKASLRAVYSPVSVSAWIQPNTRSSLCIASSPANSAGLPTSCLPTSSTKWLSACSGAMPGRPQVGRGLLDRVPALGQRAAADAQDPGVGDLLPVHGRLGRAADDREGLHVDDRAGVGLGGGGVGGPAAGLDDLDVEPCGRRSRRRRRTGRCSRRRPARLSAGSMSAPASLDERPAAAGRARPGRRRP